MNVHDCNEYKVVGLETARRVKPREQCEREHSSSLKYVCKLKCVAWRVSDPVGTTEYSNEGAGLYNTSVLQQSVLNMTDWTY